MRWDRWLPAAGLSMALALLVVAVLAEGAFRSRQALALDGRYLRLAHQLEVELREAGPGSGAEILARALADDPGHVAALEIADADGEVETRAGTVGPGRTRELSLFLGPLWAHRGGHGPGMVGRGGMMGRRGFRTLRLVESEAARQRPLAELLLLPAAGTAGLVVVALSVLGGRLLRRQQEEARSEARRRRLEALGRAGAGLAHQLRTPLATIKGSCQLLLEEAEPKTARRLDAVVEQTARMERLLGQLLDYARPPEPELENLELLPFLDEAGTLDSRVEVRGSRRGLTVRVDREHLRQILVNLVENALAAGPDDTAVEVTAEKGPDGLAVRIDDRGAGPGEDPEHLFEPYVTRRADGTGLGLPIARALAEANGGELLLTARPGGGTRAVLTLPVDDGGKR